MSEISDIGSVRSLVETALKKGFTDVVLSPGSRNAPLIISFSAISDFNCISVVDERTAAFMALGMAQQTKKPVLLSCTSGSAMLNYSPALAEAYYQRIPLIAVTADRPAEWIDQGEGQSIRQANLLNGILIQSVNLVKERSGDDAWLNQRLINEAFNTALSTSRPVQINIPLSEPLYGTLPRTESKKRKPFTAFFGKPLLQNEEQKTLNNIWSESDRILILLGQHNAESGLLEQLKALNEDPRIAVVTETTANLYHFGFVSCVDRTLEGFLSKETEPTFIPDLLVTIGENLISKKLKSLLRKHKNDINHHWHFGEDMMDTFQCLTHLIAESPVNLFSSLRHLHCDSRSEFGARWKGQFFKSEQSHEAFLETIPYTDLSAFRSILDFVPDGWQIQMGNSSVVRYIQLFNQLSGVSYFGNRGVSGIEGCTSTAVGAAMKSEQPVLLISGDHAFRYDANGLSFEYLPKNLRIIVVNNDGGNIFRIIEGPQSSSSSEQFIEHTQHKSVQKLVEYHGVNYRKADSIQTLEHELEQLLGVDDRCTVLEIFTPRIESPEVLKKYFSLIRES
jgi:2-succinyl-5-enolpyruvyl-6-hydroxy-3-cyclohexene-1-carboxylate synthase